MLFFIPKVFYHIPHFTTSTIAISHLIGNTHVTLHSVQSKSLFVPYLFSTKYTYVKTTLHEACTIMLQYELCVLGSRACYNCLIHQNQTLGPY